MESSDQFRSSDNSDSFFAVGTIIESELESEQSEDVEVNIGKGHPKYLFIFLYFLCPIFLIFGAMSTTSVFGLFYLLELTFHLIIVKQCQNSFTGIYAFLYFEIFFSIVVAIIAIVCNSDPNYSVSSRIVGSSFDTIITSTPSFAIFASITFVIIGSFPISLMGRTNVKSFKEVCDKCFQNTIFKYVIDLLHCISIAFLASTNMSYIFYPILINILYGVLSCSFVGRPVVHWFIAWVMNFYTLLYSLFEFYMVSFIGEYWNPSEHIGYQFIGTRLAKAFCIVFSSILVFTSALLLTVSPDWRNRENREVPLFMAKSNKIFFIVLTFGILIYAMFFPNYCTILWMIIIFFCYYSDMETFEKLFFPFFSFIYAFSFTLIATTQFSVLLHFEDDGRDQPLTFMKLFGIFKYIDSGKDNFGFNCVGFFFLVLIAQYGRIIHTDFSKRIKSPKHHRYDQIENINDANVENHIKRAERLLFGIRFINLIKRTIEFLVNLIYRFLVLLSLPICCVVGIYTGFYQTKWAFTLFSFISVLIVLLFLYKRPVFIFVQIVSACVILICSFYKSSDSYYCRGKDNCLYFGYFSEIDEIGIAPPPNKTLPSYLWPVIVVFFTSLFITYEPKCLQVYYSSFVTFLIYNIIAIENFIYVFLNKLTLFSMIYLILGFFMIATLVLDLYRIRKITILLSFIATSIQLAFYSLAQNNNNRNFLTSRISEHFIDVATIKPPLSEVLLVSFNIFFCSIVFYGNQNLEVKNSLTKSFLKIIRIFLQTTYFSLSWIIMFGFSIVNDYPTLIKFFILLMFNFGFLSTEFFNKARYGLLVIISIFLIAQCVFELFITDLSPLVERVLRYIGLYFSKSETLTNKEKNWSLGWQFFFILFSIFNLKEYQVITPQDNYENYTIYRKLYVSLIGLFHSFLPVIVQIALFISATFNKTIFGWITFIILICSVYWSNFFTRAIIPVLVIINLFFLVQYLLYLGYPRDIFSVKWWSILDSFEGDSRNRLEKYLTFLGLYNVTNNSLIMNFISAIVCTFYLQYNEMIINYQQRYSQLPNLLKGIVDFVTLYFFELATMLILVVASLLKSVDGLIFFVAVSFFFSANLLYGFDSKSTMTLISACTFANTGLRILSRIPLFVDVDNANYIKRAFDLPFDQQSDSSGKWIAIFALQQLCRHVMSSDLYKKCQENHIKHCAYRFIRDRQLRIIEKLDQSILIKNRNHEINSLIQNKSTSVISLSDSKIQLLTAEVKSSNKLEKENVKWYNNIYSSFIEPQLVRFIKLLATSLPINNEVGINVLTLESLTLLMKRCLNYIERNQDFHLEERERQFLLSLPPSFALQFSSISIILETPPIIDSSEYLTRYCLFLTRKIFLLLLVLISIIYIYLQPYIFGIVIFAYVICVFCSIDFKGYVNAYRIFLILVLIILLFRTISRTDLVNDGFIGASESYISIQNRIPTLLLIGLNPDNEISIEILLFVSTVLFIVEQLSNNKVFSSNYYFEKYAPSLPGFPMEYCYGIMDDPVRNLVMNIPQNKTFMNTMKYSMNRKSHRITSHHVYMLIIDIISFAILLSHWTSWEGGNDEFSSSNRSELFTINALFIFMLIIHLILFLSAYFCCLRDLYFVLYWIELLWLLFEFSMILFYIRLRNSSFLSTVKFYIFLRILQHLIVAHKCFVGRINISYRYPLFASEWKQIRLVNYFIRFCPFVFEIQTVLLWIGRPTYISLSDYSITRDMEIQLEILICNQFDKKDDEENVNEKTKNKIRIAFGVLIILIFIIVVFIPLFFHVSPPAKVNTNPAIWVNLEIGVGTFPPFYKSNGFIEQITNEEHQELAFSTIRSFNDVAKQIHDSLYVVTFPRYSARSFSLSRVVLNNLDTLLMNENYSISMYGKLELLFEHPTTVENAVDGSIFKQSGNFDHPKKLETLSLILGTNQSMTSGFHLPRIIYAVSNSVLRCSSEGDSVFNIVHESVNSYAINVANDTIDIKFMMNTTDYKAIIYSQPVSDDLNAEINNSVSGNFIGVYLLMVIIFGIVIRELVINKVDSLWRKKMDNPLKLYRMIATIGMFKNAGDIVTEKELSDQFLNTLRSREKVISLASNQKNNS